METWELLRKQLASSAQQFVAVAGSPAGGFMPTLLTAPSMALLVEGLVVGFLMGEKGYESRPPFFEEMFKGALTLFLLERGSVRAPV